MSPYQHGEVFVTDDGAETDLDLGHYERFIDINLNKYSNVTTGKFIAKSFVRNVVENTWARLYRFIPHITDALKRKDQTSKHDDGFRCHHHRSQGRQLETLSPFHSLKLFVK